MDNLPEAVGLFQVSSWEKQTGDISEGDALDWMVNILPS